MSYLKRSLLILNTAKYLKPVQLAYQVKKNLLEFKNDSNDGTMKDPPKSIKKMFSILIPQLDYSSSFLNRFSIQDLMDGKVRLLNESHQVDFCRWNVEIASHLWNYNLQYLEFLIPLAKAYADSKEEKYYELWKRIVQNWMENRNSDSYEPYTISLRIPNLLICSEIIKDRLTIDEQLKKKIEVSIYRQYVYLQKNQELWLLGNHYFENLKALLLCALYFDEVDNISKFYKRFIKQIREQILPDGVHFERSLMYHKLVTEDILRVFKGLGTCGKTQEQQQLIPVLQQMVTALYSIEKGIGRTPLFNDAGDSVAKNVEALLSAAEVVANIQPEEKSAFSSAGYYKLYSNDISVIIDCGEIGPGYMPGHAHCDCLSFELSKGNRPIFVNSGTYQYQGCDRAFYRSTRAHNTITIGDREQSECWGEHRVARRISRVNAELVGMSFRGSYRSMSSDVHIRTIKLDQESFVVLDRTRSRKRKGQETVKSYLHIADGYDVVNGKDSLLIQYKNQSLCTIYRLKSNAVISTDEKLHRYAPEFGRLKESQCIVFYWTMDDAEHGYRICFN